MRCRVLDGSMSLQGRLSKMDASGSGKKIIRCQRESMFQQSFRSVYQTTRLTRKFELFERFRRERLLPELPFGQDRSLQSEHVDDQKASLGQECISLQPMAALYPEMISILHHWRNGIRDAHCR